MTIWWGAREGKWSSMFVQNISPDTRRQHISLFLPVHLPTSLKWKYGPKNRGFRCLELVPVTIIILIVIATKPMNASVWTEHISASLYPAVSPPSSSRCHTRGCVGAGLKRKHATTHWFPGNRHGSATRLCFLFVSSQPREKNIVFVCFLQFWPCLSLHGGLTTPSCFIWKKKQSKAKKRSSTSLAGQLCVLIATLLCLKNSQRPKLFRNRVMARKKEEKCFSGKD